MPHETLVIIAILFAAQLIVGGLLRFAGALGVPRDSGWLRALMATQALVAVFAGIFLLRHPVLSVLVLTLVLGAYWMVHGMLELFDAIGHPELRGRGWMIVAGLLSVVSGGIVFFSPSLSLPALTLIIGAWLVVYGTILLVTALQLRAATRSLQASGAAPQQASPQP